MEFEKWKGEFSVDAEGTTENEVQDGNQGLLFNFVEYIKVLFVHVITQDYYFLLHLIKCANFTAKGSLPSAMVKWPTVEW